MSRTTFMVAASAAIFASGALAIAQPRPAALPPEMRRIVTTENTSGRSVVLVDGPSRNTVMLNGSRIARLWETEGMPVSIPVAEDLGAKAGNAYRPGFSGSSLYVADIPPGSGLKDIPLHKQESMDYIVVLGGEIDLVLDGGQRVRMRSGDVLIQAGNNHSWINPLRVPARLLCVTMTGQRTGRGAG